MIYLDNGATTFPKPSCVINAVNKAFRDYGANPGRGGHRMAIKASEEIYNCRRAIAALYNISDAENVIFTNNCTTALNTVIKGVLKPGDHAVISCLEHNAVVRPLEKLKKQGITYTAAQVFPGNNEKTIDSFRNSMNESTRLVICTHASNVFGIRLPVERIAALCHMYNIPICVDAAQTAGLVPVDLADSKIDYLCAPGHKGLYGPMGTGFLIINTDKIPDSLTEGGTGTNSQMTGQPQLLPDKFESGTPNLPGIAGLRAGVELVGRKTENRIFSHEIRLIQKLYKELSDNKNILLYTDFPDDSHFVPLLSFNVKGRESEEISSYLNKNYGIATRSGLHCCPLAHRFMGTDSVGTVRVVPSVFTIDSDISTLIYALMKFK